MNKILIKQTLTNKGFCGNCKHEMPITGKYCPFCGQEAQEYTIQDSIETKLLKNKVWAEVVNLDDAWSTRKSDYETHVCNGQDGSDIAFTKKTFNGFVERMRKLTNGRIK